MLDRRHRFSHRHLTRGAARASKRCPSLPVASRTAMNRTLLAACALALIPFAPAATQGPAGGMPMLPPVGGTLGGANRPATPSMPACGQTGPIDPSTQGTLREGRDLARAIATVTALPWLDDLAAARVDAAATGKPILWLQALGELDGFA